MHTSHEVGGGEASQRVVGVVVCRCIEANDSRACPVQVATAVCEYSVGLTAISDDKSLICVVLCKKKE